MKPYAAVLAVLGSLLVAGCFSASDAAAPGTTSPAVESWHGSVLVEATTSELLPVQGVFVTVKGLDMKGLTDAAGVVTLSGLPPGPQTILAAKAGHKVTPEVGRVVHVVEGETASVKFQVEARQTVTADNSYHFTSPFRGYITCGFQVAPVVAQSCNRQTLVVDSNGNSTHRWFADSILIQAVVVEAKWDPSIGVHAPSLKFTNYRRHECTPTACTFGDPWFSVTGSTPLYGMLRETADNNLTRRISTDPSKYPRQLWGEMLASCESPCSAALVFQQRYDAWITAFYGEPPPDKWSFLSAGGK